MVERVIVGPWKTNCYIYSSAKKECIIIDPGGDAGEIASRVDVLNMVPVGIAITHGHIDHVMALGKLRASYASRGYALPIAIHSADRRFLGSGGKEIHRENLESLGMDEFAFFGGESPDLPKADVRLEDGARVFGMDLVVLVTPGHTPGGVCFYAEKEGILFSGDTLFFDGVGRTDLPGGSEKKLRESILRKIAVLPLETRVFPGHGPFTTIEREKRGNVFFRQPPPQPAPARKPAPTRKPATARKPASPARAKPTGQKKSALKKRAQKKSAQKKRAKPKPPARKKRTVSKPRARKGRAGSGKSVRPAGKKGAQARRSTIVPRGKRGR